MSESPSAILPRPPESQGPATIPVRRMGRFVEGHSFDEMPTQSLPNRPTPKTPQPRIAPPTGTQYPIVEGYEIVRQLGRGGMGVVYLAREQALNRWVALKVVVGGVFAGDEAQERFQREAEAVAALQHPNIVQIFNVGVTAAGADGASSFPFIALEYADGGTLAAHTGKPMAPRVAAELVATLAEAVHYAHGQGIVHRDLKPGNVLMRIDSQSTDAEGILGRMTPKVTDFGLAKRVDANGAAIQDGSTTVAGSTLGTPEYMAPEQALGDGNIGPGVDIYALGVILFELLTARVPLQGSDALDTLVRVRSQEAPLPSRLQARLPRDLDTICSRCLQKDPARRYASAEALADDLRAWLDHRPITARPIGTVERLWKLARRRPAVASLLATVIVVAIAGYVGVLSQWRRAELRAESERQALKRASAALESAETNLYFGRIGVAQRELAIGNPWDAVRLLDACHPKDKERDLRSWEWHYLKNASHGEQLSFQASEDWVWDVVFSPDGKMLATASGSPYVDEREKRPGELQLWNATTGQLIRKFRGHTGSVLRVAMSPDGKHLCSASFDKTLRVWEVATGIEVVPPQVCHVDFNCCPANFGDAGPCWFTPDSRSVEYRGPDGQWRSLTISTGQSIPMKQSAKIALKSFDGRFAMVKHCNQRVEVVDTATNKSIGEVNHQPSYTRVAMSANGESMVYSNYQHLEQFNVLTGQRQRILDGDGSWVETMAFSNDGKKIAAAGSGRTVNVWNPYIHQPATYSGHHAEVRRVAFSPDSQRLASCDRSGKVMVWDLTRNPRQQLVTVPTDCSGQWALGFGADGASIMVVMHVAEVCHYDYSGCQFKRVPLPGLTKKTEYPRSDISFSPDGTQLVGPMDAEPNTVRHWNPMTGETTREYRGHQYPIMGTAWSADGRRLATRASVRSKRDFTTEVWVWDATTGEKLHEVTTEPVVSMALSSDGQRMCTATRTGEIKVREVSTGRDLWRGTAHRPEDYDGRPNIRIFGVAFSPNDQFVATVGFIDGTVQLWNANTGEKLHGPLPARPSLTGVTFTPDSQRVVAVGYDSEVRIWDVATGQLALTLSAPTGGRRGDTAYTARPYFSQRHQQLMVLDWSGTVAVWNGREYRERSEVAAEK